VDSKYKIEQLVTLTKITPTERTLVQQSRS